MIDYCRDVLRTAPQTGKHFCKCYEIITFIEMLLHFTPYFHQITFLLNFIRTNNRDITRNNSDDNGGGTLMTKLGNNLRQTVISAEAQSDIPIVIGGKHEIKQGGLHHGGFPHDGKRYDA